MCVGRSLSLSPSVSLNYFRIKCFLSRNFQIACRCLGKWITLLLVLSPNMQLVSTIYRCSDCNTSSQSGFNKGADKWRISHPSPPVEAEFLSCCSRNCTNSNLSVESMYMGIFLRRGTPAQDMHGSQRRSSYISEEDRRAALQIPFLSRNF